MCHPQNYNSPYSPYFISRVNFEKSQQLIQKIATAGRMLYSIEAKKNLEALITQEKPDIAHLHNIYHQISPSILHSLKKFKIPVVMTLHDYKMLCPIYTMFHRSLVCEKCKGRAFYNCLFGKCCKNSFSASLLLTLESYFHHRLLRIYDLVDAFICPSFFLKQKIDSALPNKVTFHLPNFISTANILPSTSWERNRLVYIGRLSQEKGLMTLLSAVKDLHINLKIIGEGPIKEKLIEKKNRENIFNVNFSGYLSREKLLTEIRNAMFVTVPSEWYENSPLAILEAFACGKPVIASHIGGIPELVKNDKTGFTFSPRSVDDLRSKILFLYSHPHLINELGNNARNLVEQYYSPEIYLQHLLKIYTSVINQKQSYGSSHNHNI
jgi:glycosyltransferase involved in cell wall biosynthesis